MNVPRRQENVCINKTTWPPWRQRYWGTNGLLCINTAVHSLKAGKCRDNEKKKNAVSIRKEKKITEPWVIVPNFTTTIKLFFALNSISGWDQIYIFNFLDYLLLDYSYSSYHHLSMNDMVNLGESSIVALVFNQPTHRLAQHFFFNFITQKLFSLAEDLHHKSSQPWSHT